jgi:hypothetical protein
MRLSSGYRQSLATTSEGFNYSFAMVRENSFAQEKS